jgi:hypothetical protein
VNPNRPLWRWWLFCLVDLATLHVPWPWLWRMWAWCILSAWVGADDFPKEGAQGDYPF